MNPRLDHESPQGGTLVEIRGDHVNCQERET